MPVYDRQTLRRHLGQYKLRDTYVGTTTGSCGAAGSAYVLDAAVADPSLLNDAIYQRTWLKVSGMELRVASFNTGSGAYVTLQTTGTLVPSGATYEHHKKLRPSEKDRQLDRIIERLWTREEVTIPTVDGLLNYSIGQGFKVFGAYYFASPVGTLDRDIHDLAPGWTLVTTGSGRELRLPLGTALAASQQLVLDAQVRSSLGAGDAATVNIPDEDWVLNGAAARCYQSLIADAPGQEAGKYSLLAQGFAKSFVAGIGAFRDPVRTGWRGAFDEIVAD